MLTSKLMPWHIAMMSKTFVAWATVPIIASETFWRTWYEVFREK